MRDKPSGCLGFIFRLFSREQTQAASDALPKVQVNKYFVSNAEADFFRVLTRVVGDSGHVLAQVSLGRLLWLPGNNQTNPNRQRWQNKINAWSVDFVVCDPATLRPIVVIELDEPRHTEPKKQTRDDDVKDILEAAGLPIVNVITSRMYDTRELTDVLRPYLGR